MFELIRRSNNNHIADYYNPFREMEELERRFFGRSFDSFFSGNALAEFKTDITDEGSHYMLEADLPGFAKENIHLQLDGDTLTIQAERNAKNEQKDKDNKLIRCERSYGTYTRQFDVSGIDTDAIKVRYENGVLKLTLPKKELLQPASRRLEIE